MREEKRELLIDNFINIAGDEEVRDVEYNNRLAHADRIKLLSPHEMYRYGKVVFSLKKMKVV